MTRARATGRNHPLDIVASVVDRDPAPFFESGPSPWASPRRMMLISYSFVPSVLIGALRWRHLSRFAVERGWAIDVIMMEPSDEASADRSLLQELAAGIRLFAVPLRETAWQRTDRALLRVAKRILHRSPDQQREPVLALDAVAPPPIQRGDADTALLRLRRTQLAKFFFSQADAWIDRAVHAGLWLHRAQPYDLIVSSGPPHMAHMAARRIARSAALPYVIDLRDPIALPEVEPPDMRSAYWRSRAVEWERNCVRDAALVVLTADGTREALADRYPESRMRLLTAMNGADPDVKLVAQPSPTFVLANTGTIYMGRDPRTLFEAFKLAVSRRGLTPEDIGLHFMGDTAFEGVPLEWLGQETGIAEHLVVEPSRPRADAHALMERAGMLVVLPQSHPRSLPAKIFEYAQAPAWMLVLAEPGSSVHNLMSGSGADVHEPRDIEGIARTIEARFDAFRRGERPQPLNAGGRFDRAPQALRLFDALDRIA